MIALQKLHLESRAQLNSHLHVFVKYLSPALGCFCASTLSDLLYFSTFQYENTPFLLIARGTRMHSNLFFTGTCSALKTFDHTDTSPSLFAIKKSSDWMSQAKIQIDSTHKPWCSCLLDELPPGRREDNKKSFFRRPSQPRHPPHMRKMGGSNKKW